MTWNHDIPSAPRDGSRFLMATTDGNIFFTRWLKPNKFTPNGRFDGFSENAKTLMAWHDVPKHPSAEINSLETASTGAVTGWVDPPSTETGSSDLRDANSAETNGGTRVTAGETATHFILDDCGSGA